MYRSQALPRLGSAVGYVFKASSVRNSCTTGALAPICRAARLAALSSSSSGSIDANCVSVDRGALQMACEGHDRTRVHASGQIGAHGHVRPQSLRNSVQHEFLEFIHQPAGVASWILLSPVWEIHFPVSAFLDHGRRPSAPRGDMQITARRQELHALQNTSPAPAEPKR